MESGKAEASRAVGAIGAVELDEAKSCRTWTVELHEAGCRLASGGHRGRVLG